MKRIFCALAMAALCVGCATDDYDNDYRGGTGRDTDMDAGYETSGDLDRTRDPIMDDNWGTPRDRAFPGRTGPGEMNPHLPY